MVGSFMWGRYAGGYPEMALDDVLGRVMKYVFIAVYNTISERDMDLLFAESVLTDPDVLWLAVPVCRGNDGGGAGICVREVCGEDADRA